MVTSAGTTDALIQALIAWIDRLFPDPPRGERLKRSLADRFGGDSRMVTAEVRAEVECVCHEHSRHLDLQFVPDGSLTPDSRSPGWPPSNPVEMHARAAHVREVSRRADGVGVLVLDGLDDLAVAAPYLEAAFALLRSSRAIVLDVRENRGGDPGTVALVLDWLLGQEPKHLSDVISRDHTRPWWTAGRPAELALPAATPVAALIGRRTYSSGEALAYHLQSQGRGRILGQASRGAADHVTPIRLTSHVNAFVPEGYVRDAVTGGNWEAVGVKPDFAVDEGDVLAAAVELLLRAIP